MVNKYIRQHCVVTLFISMSDSAQTVNSNLSLARAALDFSV
jgi:hypothetical protein